MLIMCSSNNKKGVHVHGCKTAKSVKTTTKKNFSRRPPHTPQTNDSNNDQNKKGRN